MKAVRFLRDKFVAYAQDETLDPRERDSSIAAVGELIEQLGGKPSSSPGKVYSTPSGAEEATVPVARGPVSGLRDVGRRKELEKKGKGKGSDSYPAKGDGKGKGKGGKGKAGDAKKKKRKALTVTCRMFWQPMSVLRAREVDKVPLQVGG